MLKLDTVRKKKKGKKETLQFTVSEKHPAERSLKLYGDRKPDAVARDLSSCFADFSSGVSDFTAGSRCFVEAP